jgi:RNA polymerase sigma-70 factor, ECF subfamily
MVWDMDLVADPKGGVRGELRLEGASHRSDLEERVTEIFGLWRESVCRYLLGITGDPAEAEDLAQEVFLRLYSYLQRGQDVENVRAWIFRVAHNLAIDEQRKRGALESLDAETWGAIGKESRDPAPDAEQRILEREKQAKLVRALSRLSPQERHCLNLRTEGLRYREIAEVLGIRIPTVVTFLTRGIKKIMRDKTDE